jgi:hypothetical protein
VHVERRPEAQRGSDGTYGDAWVRRHRCASSDPNWQKKPKPDDHLVSVVVRRRAQELNVPSPGLQFDALFLIGIADGEVMSAAPPIVGRLTFWLACSVAIG